MVWESSEFSLVRRGLGTEPAELFTSSFATSRCFDLQTADIQVLWQ